ncbi:MAG: hypothetical protein WCP45_16660 [Verrucomicrobiota bacterium]
MQPADESPKRVSTKLDGVYARATAAGIESKSGKPLDLPHIHKRLERHFRKYPDGELKGELFRPGAGVEKIAGEVKAGGSVAKGLRIHLFPDQGPRPLPVGAVRRVHAQTAKTAGDVDRIYQKAVKRGEEGVMIRHPDGTIEKRKPRDTSEHVVTRASAGTRGVMEVATAGERLPRGAGGRGAGGGVSAA